MAKRIILWWDGRAVDVEAGSHFEAEHRARGWVDPSPIASGPFKKAQAKPLSSDQISRIRKTRAGAKPPKKRG